LVFHCAALGKALIQEDPDIANESWRSLPRDLQKLVEDKEGELQEGY